MNRDASESRQRAIEDPIHQLSLLLSLGVAGFLANAADDPLQSRWPELVEQLWVRLAIGVAVFLIFSLLLWFLSRAILRASLNLYLKRFEPHRIARFVPGFIAGSEQDNPKSAQVQSVLDHAARELARKMFGRLIKPAIPGTVRAFQDLRRQVSGKPSSGTIELVRAMSERCMYDIPLTASPPREITYSDPVHGTIEFPAEFRWLLTQPTLQRLNEIRQLPFAFPKYPGATHTRFSHSIGVAHLARTVMQRVLDRGVIYTATGTKQIPLDDATRARFTNLATICGLVHDIGHAPLGHTLDRFFRTQFFEGEGTSDADKEFLPRVLERLAEPIRAIDEIGFHEVVQILAGENLSGWSEFVSQLINSKLDVDRIDYLQRDAHFTGQLEGLLNVEALVSSIRPFERDDKVFLTFDESYLGDVEQFVYARDVMYLRCYEHQYKVVSEALCSRGVDGLFELVPELRENLDHFAMLTDAQLLEIVNSLPEREDGGPRDLFRRAFRCDALAYTEVDSVPFVESAVEHWLYGLLSDFVYPSESLISKIAETERKIAKAADIDAGELVLVLPDPKANEERSIVLDILILGKADAGYKAIPLLSEEEDTSPSEVLQRRKFVSKELVDAAATLEEVRKAAATGISLLGIIRRARFKLRLFLRTSRLEDSEARVKDAFRALGVSAKVSSEETTETGHRP